MRIKWINQGIGVDRPTAVHVDIISAFCLKCLERNCYFEPKVAEDIP